MNEIKEYTEKVFEDIKHIDGNYNEYWSARELQKVLKYTQWRRFENTIDKAKIACEKSNINVYDQFANVGKMVDIGSNTKGVDIILKNNFPRLGSCPKETMEQIF